MTFSVSMIILQRQSCVCDRDYDIGSKSKPKKSQTRALTTGMWAFWTGLKRVIAETDQFQGFLHSWFRTDKLVCMYCIRAAGTVHLHLHLHVWLFEADYTICVFTVGGCQWHSAHRDSRSQTLSACKMLNSQDFKNGRFTAAKPHATSRRCQTQYGGHMPVMASRWADSKREQRGMELCWVWLNCSRTTLKA